MESSTMPYDERALRVLEFTKEEALALKHNYMGTEHLLLGIIREGSGAEALTSQGVTIERVRGGIMFVLGQVQIEAPSGDPGFTPRTQVVLTMAGEEAQREGAKAISPYHMLVAIMREGQGIAAGLLQAMDVILVQNGETVRISRVPETNEPIIVPEDIQAVLLQYPAAQAIFEKLSTSRKKHLLSWIEQAVGAEERKQQIMKLVAILRNIP